MIQNYIIKTGTITECIFTENNWMISQVHYF